MYYRSWQGFCLASEQEALFPMDTIPDPELSLFSPLVLLVRDASPQARGLYRIGSLSELSEANDLTLLLPPETPLYDLEEAPLEMLIRAEGATVLNVAYQRAFPVLRAWYHRPSAGLSVSLVGLGDVGGTVLTGLKLLGTEFGKIRIFDPNEKACARYELEMNQVITPGEAPLPRVEICSFDTLFDCDLLLFTAARGVPPVGSEIKDVRMAQFEVNRTMLDSYAAKARETGFTGLFCQISDPVDHLAQEIFLHSNTNEAGDFDFGGLLPEQIQGFGLGVMAGRAAYYAEKKGLEPGQVQVFGPHGQGLIVANDLTGYDPELSEELTTLTREANLKVRELGYKPYIAPGLSSAAISILRMLRGQLHYGAIPLGGIYFGCRSVMTRQGSYPLRQEMDPRLFARLTDTYRQLKEFWDHE